ncbi:MAG: hypothetical protein EP315_06000 [Gammaproteobacteria bacterium]|nr:MAG: hypothetical protein EP315_06000 [Gammaproteobacteria bacterium]
MSIIPVNASTGVLIMLLRYFAVIVLLLSVASVRAQETEIASPSLFNRPGTFYCYLGDFDAEVTPGELDHPTSEFAFGLGALFDYTDHVDWGLDMLLVTRQYDTPSSVSGGAFTVVSDDMTLDTVGLTIHIRFKFPTSYAIWYAGAGGGLYFSRLTLTASTFGLPGSHEEKSNDLGLSYYWGMAFNISNQNYLGLEYRYLSVDANLSPVTTAEHEVGGELLFMSYSFTF